MYTIVPHFAREDLSYTMEISWHLLSEYEDFEGGTGI
jgi:hypothetical protein